MRTANDSLITSAIDMSSPWTSDALWCGNVAGFSISLVFEGAPEGLLRLQCSNDRGDEKGPPPYSADIENWTTIDGSLQLIDEAGDHTWSVSEVAWRWTRVQWIPSSGTGSIVDVRFNSKGF